MVFRHAAHIVATALLLTVSNVFMTFAWHGRLEDRRSQPWVIAALASRGVAFFEYLFRVPASRIGCGALALTQLKPDFLGAGLCLVGVAHFILRGT